MAFSPPVSYTDLLIIGAGPAGLMAAAWASQYHLSTRIVDKNEARITKGHADALQARTLEILDSFDVVDHVWRKGFHDIEICTWNNDCNGRLQRSQRVLAQKIGISRFSQCYIHQGVIEQTLLDLLKTNGRVRVERNVVPDELVLDRSVVDLDDAYPITIVVRHVLKGKAAFHTAGTDTSNATDGQSGNDVGAGINATEEHGTAARVRTEIIKAKYLLGCDGAHSWTRQQLGLPMEGEHTDHLWGVIDIIPLTNFPDIRQACLIHSAHGSILNVPREDRLNRLYIQLGVDSNSLDPTQITPESIFKAAQKMMEPYTLNYRYCDWWSSYRIGQRVSPKFSVDDRIFLAGDAIHTHSPKLGQGMNVSMQDTYNLVWKLGAVINGSAKRAILKTYQAERRQVALDLLAIDREASRFYSQGSGKPSTLHEKMGPESTNFKSMRERMHEFIAGVGVTYGQSPLVAQANNADPSSTDDSDSDSGERRQLTARQDLARNIKLGARLPSFRIINQAEARPIQLADMLKSDGRWRVIVFAGDLLDAHQFSRVQRLGTKLALPTSFLYKYTPANAPVDSVIELLTVHASPRTAVELSSLHDVFHPYDEGLGWDYWKVFADDVAPHEGFDDAYGKYGVSRREGCIVVCRPDQHVGYIGALEDADGVERYFADILIPRA